MNTKKVKEKQQIKGETELNGKIFVETKLLTKKNKH